MENRDYLERQIEQLGLVLAILTAKVLGAESVYFPFVLSEVIAENKKGIMDTNRWPITSLQEALKLVDRPAWNNTNTETMIEVLLNAAERSSLEDRKTVLDSAAFLLEALNKTEDTASFNRLSLMERLHELNTSEHGV